jgi:acyl-CoA dehydrogenase
MVAAPCAMIRDHTVLQAFTEQVSRFVRDRLVPFEAEVAETDRVPPEIIAEMRALGRVAQ